MIASTSTTTDDQHVPGLTDGHVTAYGHAFTAPGLGTFIVGEGDVVSTTADMARWLIVHANGGRTADGTRLISAEGTRLLHTPSAREAGYALGWSARGPADATTRLEHSGNLHTFTSEQAIWPETRYGVVLLFNAGSPMILDQNAIVHGVFDIVEGTTPPSSGPHLATRLDSGLAVLTIVALTLGAFGVARARRWSRRRHTPVRRALTLLPAVMVLGAGPAFPHLVETLLSRDVTWRAAAYGWPALVVFVLAALLAAAATLLVRAWHWARTSRVDPRRGGRALRPSEFTGASRLGSTHPDC
jgi:CubicO group peptidase (beta-lactamase class C family)